VMEKEAFENGPWLTGPLIAPSSHVTPVGQYSMEPYYVFVDYYGFYNSDWKVLKGHHFWVHQLQIFFSTGLTSWMGFAISPQAAVQRTQGVNSLVFNDLSMGFDFQILTDTEDNYLPAVKLGIREVFPTGKYQHLRASKHSTDAGGTGAFQTEFILATSRLIHLRNEIWLNLRWTFACSISSRVHVHGRNYYGDSIGANGYVYPPFAYGWDFAFELTLSRNWALACDLVGGYGTKRRFKGYAGVDEVFGLPFIMTRGSQAFYQLAPALEYNFTERLGVIAGAWLSLAGRNTLAFNGSQFAININF
jgi:hypothetical protein